MLVDASWSALLHPDELFSDVNDLHQQLAGYKGARILLADLLHGYAIYPNNGG